MATARSKRREGARAIEQARAGARRAHYDDVRAQIQTGDILLYRGRTFMSRLIRWASWSVYSHVAIAAWWQDHLVVFESRGSGGVTVKPLSRAIEHYDGQIDWWALREDLSAQLDRKALLHWAIAELGKPYAFRGVLSLGWRIVLGRLVGTRDPVSLPEAHFCSQYVSACFRQANVDLVPSSEDACTSPGAIARSGSVSLRAVLRRAPARR